MSLARGDSAAANAALQPDSPSVCSLVTLHSRSTDRLLALDTRTATVPLALTVAVPPRRCSSRRSAQHATEPTNTQQRPQPSMSGPPPAPAPTPVSSTNTTRQRLTSRGAKAQWSTRRLRSYAGLLTLACHCRSLSTRVIGNTFCLWRR